MPPASPLPGWSSGLVWTETVAMRRGRPRRTGITLIRPASARSPVVLLTEPRRILPDSPPVTRPEWDTGGRGGRIGAMTRTAVVTGASSGIGAATVRRLRAEGFEVWAGARRTELLDALAAETGAHAIHLDVTDQESV